MIDYSGRTGVFDVLMAWLMSMPSLSVEVAQPGKKYTPKSGTPYLRVSFQPNVPDQSQIGFSESRADQGIFQVSVLWPSGEGTLPAMELAEKIAQRFSPRAEPLTRPDRPVIVRISDHPFVGGVLVEDGDKRLMVPVTTYWQIW